MPELMVKDSTYWMKLQVKLHFIIQAVISIQKKKWWFCVCNRGDVWMEALKVMYTVAMPLMGNFGI